MMTRSSTAIHVLRSSVRRRRRFTSSVAATAAATVAVLLSPSGTVLVQQRSYGTIPAAATTGFVFPARTFLNKLSETQRRVDTFQGRLLSAVVTGMNEDTMMDSSEGDEWSDILPLAESSHRSATIQIPREDDIDHDVFNDPLFPDQLAATVEACRNLGKSSVWIEVPMNRCSLIERGNMQNLGFRFHHALGETAVLNLWLNETTESKVPDFATHNVGVGAVVVNSRDEILCVRELRKNYMPWKTPTGLSELGEQIDEAAVREVMEETGIRTQFHSILSFRQTHGLAHGRSDLFFVCRLDPIEEPDGNGNPIIEEPNAQACEIETASWIPLSEYRAMINDEENGHPMMRHVMELYDAGKHIGKNMVHSVIPGRKPNAMYYPSVDYAGDSDDELI